MKRRHFFINIVAAAICSCGLLSCGNAAVPEHEHVWDAGHVTLDPTCTTEGRMTYECTVPGCPQYKHEAIAMLPHNWDEGTITVVPTCSEPGVKTFTCQNEGCEEQKTVLMPKESHHFEEGALVRVPDLLEEGARELHCHECGEHGLEAVAAHADFGEQFDTLAENWVVAQADSFDPAQEQFVPTPLELNDGRYQGEGVEITEESVSLSAATVAIGYVYSRDAEKVRVNADIDFAATDIVDGYLAQTDLDGHVKRATKVSGDAQTWEYLSDEAWELAMGDVVYFVLSGTAEATISFTLSAECVHVWDEGEIIKTPTCQHEGEFERTCIVCGEKKIQSIDKVPHQYGEGVVVVEPTDISDGVMEYTCAVCGDTVTESIPKKMHEVANYYDDFSTAGDNGWVYGYATGFNFGTGDFTFNSLTAIDENEWGGVSGLIIKRDWLLTEAGGKDLAVGYQVPEGYTSLLVNLGFTSVAAAEGKTRLSARVIVHDATGKAKYCKFIDDGINNADWEIQTTVSVVPGGTVYCVLFPESVDWRQGALKMNLFGREETSSEPINLEGRIKHRLDDDGGNIDLESNIWLTDDGYKAHIEVTKACQDVWRAALLIDTGVAFEVGKTYGVSFDIERLYDTPYAVILQNKEDSDPATERYQYLTSPVGAVSLDVTVPEGVGGSLWICIELGDVVNEIMISNIVVSPK